MTEVIDTVTDTELYPMLSTYSDPLRAAERVILGRDHEIQQVMSSLCRAELCNVMLLAEPGTGKTALVQGTMLHDHERDYREVDVSKMISNTSNADEMATRLKQLFDEASLYSRHEGRELVLFIDEFHQIVQLSDAAVEAMKPILSQSGVLGVKIIAATTYDEFRQFISPNAALVERLQRINVSEPDRLTTIAILRGMSERYGVSQYFEDDVLFEAIYEYTNRYVPAAAQPRKSILALDSMIGWHRSQGVPLTKQLLAKVLYDSYGVNVAFSVDASTIKSRLDSAVFAQELATSIVSRRLYLCVADLHDKTRPMASFLFTGSTGTGKTELAKQLAKILFGDISRHFIRFDMTEFSNANSVDRFRDKLTSDVWARPFSVVLLDEIEKAAPEVTRIFLQVLDDGRMSDRNDRQVSFLNCYFIFTTNSGAEIYKTINDYQASDTGDGAGLRQFESLIRRHISGTSGDNKFPSELLGRIDNIIPFQPLSDATKRRIVNAKLADLREQLFITKGIDCKFDKRVTDYLVGDKSNHDSDGGGARNILAKLTDEVKTEIAIFTTLKPEVQAITVAVEGTMRTHNKELREGDARIVIHESTPRQRFAPQSLHMLGYR